MKNVLCFGKKPCLLTAALLLAFLFTGSFAYSEVIQTAVSANVADDYSSGAHSVISVEPVGGPRTVRNNLLPTISDITVNAYGRYFYRTERYNGDNVTKFDIASPDKPIWQFSTLSSEDKGTGNPQGLIFVNAEKAYILRMGSTKAWIVNPSAVKESEFKIGELDLGSYADSDGNPEMNSGIVAKGKLFITLIRYDQSKGWALTNTAYIAVFDIATDKEITTGIKNEDGVKGIPLPVKNPGAAAYLSENNMLYVQGTGGYASTWSGTPAEYSGGIVSINPDTYETKLILDDDADGVPLYGGNISGMAIISPTKGYLTVYTDADKGSVRTFNPSAETAGNIVAGLDNKSISGMDSGVYPDKNLMLWVCNHTDARIDIVNTASDTIDESISTNLNPNRIVFCEEVLPGFRVTDKLWIRAVIKTEEKGEIEALWKEGGREKTQGGDEVIYGHFYASPSDVNWGSGQNPDVFVKIWFDRSGRIDVNFFHVSVPEIRVSSAYPYTGSPAEEDTATITTRYIRHWYENGESHSQAQ